MPPGPPNPNGAVRVLMIDAGRNLLDVGGDFSTIAGSARNGLARFDLGTGALDASWAPLPAGTQNRVGRSSATRPGACTWSGHWGSARLLRSLAASRAHQCRRSGRSGLGGQRRQSDSHGAHAGTGKVLLAGSFSRIEDSDRGAVAVVGEGSDLIFADHMDNTCAQ